MFNINDIINLANNMKQVIFALLTLYRIISRKSVCYQDRHLIL